MRRGVNGLKPEMTSIASARQAATMIKNGKKEREGRESLNLPTNGRKQLGLIALMYAMQYGN